MESSTSEYTLVYAGGPEVQISARDFDRARSYALQAANESNMQVTVRTPHDVLFVARPSR